MIKYLKSTLLALAITLAGCSMPELQTKPPMVDQQSLFETLSVLPPSEGKPLVVGVYSLLDQTGQRSFSGNGGSSMSTVLPQGLSSILVQELQRTGDGSRYRVGRARKCRSSAHRSSHRGCFTARRSGQPANPTFVARHHPDWWCCIV